MKVDAERLDNAFTYEAWYRCLDMAWQEWAQRHRENKSMQAVCIQCGGKSVESDGLWHPGECCVGGCLFACSKECGVAFASSEECVSGTKVEECYDSPEAPESPSIFRTVYTKPVGSAGHVADMLASEDEP
jgi:hypothetical protein